MKTYLQHNPVTGMIIELVEKREYDKLRAANAELIERLRERTESHIAASARDVQTIQRQSVLLERWKNIATGLQRLVGGAPKSLGPKWENAAVSALDQYDAALSAYESANLEPVNQIDEAVKRMEAVPVSELITAYCEGPGRVGIGAVCCSVRARLIQAAKSSLG